MGAGRKCDTVNTSMEFVQQLGALSYLGVFIVGLLATIVIPVPEEISLLTLGYLCATGIFQVVFVIPIVMLGLFISDCFIYYLSTKGTKFIRKLYDKVFQGNTSMLRDIPKKRLERIIVLSRFLVYLRFLAPFLSGYHKIGLKRFAFLESISITIHVSIYVLLGFFLRNQLEHVLVGINTVEHILAIFSIAIIISVLFFILKQFTTRYLKITEVPK